MLSQVVVALSADRFVEVCASDQFLTLAELLVADGERGLSVAALADSVKLFDFLCFGNQVTNDTKVVSLCITHKAGHDYDFAKVGCVFNERYRLIRMSQ